MKKNIKELPHIPNRRTTGSRVVLTSFLIATVLGTQSCVRDVVDWGGTIGPSGHTGAHDTIELGVGLAAGAVEALSELAGYPIHIEVGR